MFSLQSLKKIARNHAAFFIMLLCSLCTFLSIVLVKNSSSDTVFSLFTIFQIYIGYVVVLGALASDSVAIRFASAEGSKLIIDKSILLRYFFSVSSALLLFSILGYLIFDDFSVNGFVVLLLSFVIVCLNFFSMCFRLLSCYVLSQLMQNGWKIFFFIFIVIGVYFKGEYSEGLLVFIFLVSLLIPVPLCFYFYKKFDLVIVNSVSKADKIEQGKLQVTYITSLLFFAVLDSFDRVVLQNRLSAEDFSNYSYLVSVLLFPVGIIGNYIGFKELVRIKNGAAFDLRRKSIHAFFLGLFLFLVYSAFLYLCNGFLNINFEFYIWICVLCIVCCKIPYSYSSAVLGARGESSDIRGINLFSLFFVFFACVVAWLMADENVAITLVLLIWIIRFFIYYKKAGKYV